MKTFSATPLVNRTYPKDEPPKEMRITSSFDVY